MKQITGIIRCRGSIFLITMVTFLFLISKPLTAQTIKMPSSSGFITTPDSVQLFYTIQGQGNDTLVVVHGGPYNSGYLSPDLVPLAAHHVLLYYDQRAAGFSSTLSDTSRLGISNHTDDLETIRKHFHIQKLNLIGHSTGGIICGFYTVAHPEKINSLILIDPVPAKAGWKLNFGSQLDSLSNVLKKQNQKKFQHAPEDTIKACWDYYALYARGFYPSPVMVRRMWGDVCNCLPANTLNPAKNYIHSSLGNYDITGQLKNVKVPVLIIGGSQDGIPAASFEQWDTFFPNSTLVTVPRSGHFPHVDEPNVFFTAVERFLQHEKPGLSIFEKTGAGVVLPGDKTGTPYQRARAEVIQVENELVRQVNKGNWNAVAGIYAPDAWIMAPGAPPVTGRQSIASFWHTAAIRGMHSLELQLMEIEYSGDLLFGKGKYVMRDKQNEFLDIGKFIAIYKRVNNKWELYTDIFNSSMETRSPIAIPDYLKVNKE